MYLLIYIIIYLIGIPCDPEYPQVKNILFIFNNLRYPILVCRASFTTIASIPCSHVGFGFPRFFLPASICGYICLIYGPIHLRYVRNSKHLMQF